MASEASNTPQDLVARLTPSLHRFARALLGGRGRVGSTDQFLQGALGRFRAVPQATIAETKIALYACVVMAHRARHSTFAPVPSTSRTGRGGIARLIETLPLDQREVLLLVVLEQLTYDEVAAVLGLPRAAIVARLMHARSSFAAGSDEPQRATHLRLVK